MKKKQNQPTTITSIYVKKKYKSENEFQKP